MPTKRRVGKARHLEPYQLWQLIEGPDASRQQGMGYLASYGGRAFDGLSPEEQAEVEDLMRADWVVYGPTIMDWWRTGEPLRGVPPWIFPMPGSPDRLPWAAEAFGEPEQQQGTRTVN